MSSIHPYWMIGATAAFAIIPILLGVATSFLKIHIVLSLIKNALGTQQVPGPLVVSMLSLALTVSVMMPVFEEMYQRGIECEKNISLKQFRFGDIEKLKPVLQPLKQFLNTHTGEKEIGIFVQHVPERNARIEQSEISLRILIPAFMLTELREAFSMGFVVLLPFLIVDLIVANILTGLGMYMMSPVTISLPLKLILFVVTDAWLIIVRGLMQSYSGGIV